MATTPSAADFDRDTAVAAAGDGAWSATISEHWGVPPRNGPNGGYIAAMVLRAMLAQLDDPARAPRSLTLHYLRPPAPGPCTLHVTVERTGRSLSSLSARMVQNGQTLVVALGAFAPDFPSAATYAQAPPDVGPPPAQLRIAPTDAGLPPIAHRTAVAPVFGGKPYSGSDDALTGGWLRLAQPRVPDALALAFYADAWLPSAYTRLTAPAPAPTIDLTIHFRTRLPHPGMAPEDPVLARFSSSTAFGGFFEEDGALWAPDGTLLVQSRQLALLYPGS